MDVEVRTRTAPWRWTLLFSVIVLNIFLPTLILSYGTILVHSVSAGAETWLAFTTPTVFLCTYCMTQCWSREAADSWGGDVGYRVMAASGLGLLVAGVFTSAFMPFNLQPFIYGGFGGFGSSLITAQVDAVLFESYDTKLGIIRGLCFFGQAIGHSIFPHIITALVNYYGLSLFFIVLSGIMLQTLPAIMFLKVHGNIKRPTSHSRYSDVARTYALFNNELPSNGYTNEIQLKDINDKICWKNPTYNNAKDHVDFDLYDDDDEISQDKTVTVTPPPSPEEKRRNLFGVEILPEIPEESEDSDNASIQRFSENKNKRFSDAIKRLSSIGDSFDDYIVRQTRNDSETDQYSSIHKYSEVDVTYDNIAPMTEITREKVFNSFSFRCRSRYASIRRRFWMPSYRVYRIRRRLQYIMYSFNDTLLKPLTRSLTCWRFYPTLLLSVARLSLIAVSLTLLPLIDMEIEPPVMMFETNFMISLHGFMWTCFLVGTPWLAEMPKRNNKFITCAGLVLSSAACFVIAKATNRDTLCIGCVVAGLGFGAVVSCWEASVYEFVGAYKWPKIHSTVETLSGILLTTFVGGLSYAIKEQFGLQFCMMILSYFFMSIAILWCIISIVAVYLNKIRRF